MTVAVGAKVGTSGRRRGLVGMPRGFLAANGTRREAMLHDRGSVRGPDRLRQGFGGQATSAEATAAKEGARYVRIIKRTGNRLTGD
jgi:hypothetical protein